MEGYGVQAYGAVANFGFSVTNIRNIFSFVFLFVFLKSWLSYLEDQGLITKPKLELQAVVLAFKLKIKILDEIDIIIDSKKFWTDSQFTLSYIKSTSRKFSVYMMNCLNEIGVNSNVEEWFFILGILNTVDHCICYLKFLCTNSLITCEIEFIQVEVQDMEQNTHAMVSQENKSDMPVIKWEDYSSYLKLLRHFEVETALDKCEKKPTHTINLKELTVGEIKNTEHQILRGKAIMKN